MLGVGSGSGEKQAGQVGGVVAGGGEGVEAVPEEGGGVGEVAVVGRGGLVVRGEGREGDGVACLPDLWGLLAVYLIDVDRMEIGKGIDVSWIQGEKGMFDFGDDKDHTSFRDDDDDDDDP